MLYISEYRTQSWVEKAQVPTMTEFVGGIAVGVVTAASVATFVRWVSLRNTMPVIHHIRVRLRVELAPIVERLINRVGDHEGHPLPPELKTTEFDDHLLRLAYGINVVWPGFDLAAYPEDAIVDQHCAEFLITARRVLRECCSVCSSLNERDYSLFYARLLEAESECHRAILAYRSERRRLEQVTSKPATDHGDWILHSTTERVAREIWVVRNMSMGGWIPYVVRDSIRRRLKRVLSPLRRTYTSIDRTNYL
jgi:hypothetical protein